MSFTQVAEELVASADHIADETFHHVWGIPGYDESHLQRDELARRARFSIRASLAALATEGPPDAAAVDAAREIGASRALQGVPVDAVMQSWHTAERICTLHLVEHADRLTAAELRGGVRRLSQVVGELTRRSIEEYRRTQTEVTAHYDQLATDLVAQLVSGRLTDPDEVARRAQTVGSVASRQHAAIAIAVPTADPAVNLRVERHLLAGLAKQAEGRILVGRADEQHLLLCPLATTDTSELHELLRLTVADPHRPGQVLLGTCRSTADLANAATVCRRAQLAVDVAVRLGWTDRLTCFDDVAPEVLLLRRDDVTDVLTDLLAPLRDRPELLDTLRAYLRSGLSARAAARDLYVHQNTVPQRLRTVERLLGRSLTDVTQLLDVLLALRALDLSPTTAETEGPGTA